MFLSCFIFLIYALTIINKVNNRLSTPRTLGYSLPQPPIPLIFVCFILLLLTFFLFTSLNFHLLLFFLFCKSMTIEILDVNIDLRNRKAVHLQEVSPSSESQFSSLRYLSPHFSRGPKPLSNPIKRAINNIPQEDRMMFLYLRSLKLLFLILFLYHRGRLTGA